MTKIDNQKTEENKEVSRQEFEAGLKAAIKSVKLQHEYAKLLYELEEYRARYEKIIQNKYETRNTNSKEQVLPTTSGDTTPDTPVQTTDA